MTGKDPDPLLRDLGARVRRLREQLKMTQAELAAEVGLTRSSISNLEAGRQGNTPATGLVKLAHILGVTVGGLLGEVPLPSLPLVEVVIVCRVECEQCGMVVSGDSNMGTDDAEQARRDHLRSHREAT